jgi:hypothetical protein
MAPNLRRFTGISRPFMLMMLTVSTGMSLLTTTVRAEYEEPPTLSATELLGPELVKGPNHTVVEQVRNDGLFNHYTVDSPFAAFEVSSTSALKFLINEINAIAEMKKVKTDDTAVASLKQSAENTATGIKNLFTNTEETLKGAASGVQSLFHRAKETIGSRDPTSAEDNRAKQIIGYSKAKGDIATTYNVNVYSRNQVLQEELDRLAWADYLGGLGVGLATAAVPGVGGVVLSASGTARLLNEAINTTPASELWVQNRDKLVALGLASDTVQLFLNNEVFSPALATVMTSALEAMKGVDNLELFLKVCLQASTPDMASVITDLTVLTAGYHMHVKPLAGIVPMARITRAIDADGKAVVVVPADYVVWSGKLHDALNQVSEETKGDQNTAKELWVLGNLSARALDESEKAGWTVHTGAGAQLLPQKQ